MVRPRIRRRVLLRQALSYAIIIIISFLMFLYGTAGFKRVFREEVARSNAAFLDNVSGEIETSMRSLQAAVSFAAGSHSLWVLLGCREDDPSFSRKASELQRDLREYYVSEGIYLLLYYPEWDYLSSNGTSNKLTPLYNMQKMKGMSLDEEQWRNLLSQTEKGFFFSENLRLGDMGQQMVFHQTLRLRGKEVKVFAMLPPSAILRQELPSGETLLISDGKGNLLTSWGDRDIPLEQIPRDVAAGASSSGGGEEYILTSRHAPLNDWIFSIATPVTVYWSAMQRVNRLFFFAIAISLVLGTTAASLLLRQNYKPVQMILNMIKNKAPAKNEYEVILSSYRQMAQENHIYRDQLDKGFVHMRSHYMISLLKGRKYNLPETEMDAYYSLDVKEKSLCLVMLSAEYRNNTENIPQKEQEADELLLFALKNVFTEMINAYPFYLAEDGQQMLFLLYLNQEELDAWEQEKEKLTSFVADFFQEKLNADVQGVVSSYTASFDQIHKLYSETSHIMGQMAILGETGIVFAEQYNANHGVGYQPAEAFEDLAKAVSQGDADTALELSANLFSHWKNSLGLLRIEVNNCMYHILENFNRQVPDAGARQTLTNHMIDLAMNSPSLEILQQKFEDCLRYACSAISNTVKGFENQFISEVEEYLEEHYSDCNLNISSVADHFQKHPNYLSYAFCKETGKGLLESIHQIRIRHAVELLDTTNLTIEQISRQVGFGNSRTFRRAFVKYRGYNPSQHHASKADDSLEVSH
ncbi:MAG TPA: helix-turn-helix transcriptional regulator [Candidatus Eisenbergiella merdipullorum]|uniref:Helix-turn-helix transcriptional regulator n=1 Tax=Candidatus Eisenbergiella merdipullorum TaxID=2838553 RepID=A0A9D2I317_9FIRM|nr:helix-turn-helix transcriptional regulator [Candidatus Eisenbergiella merdipullorum]